MTTPQQVDWSRCSGQPGVGPEHDWHDLWTHGSGSIRVERCERCQARRRTTQARPTVAP
jgi:hypothetical protein